MTYKVEVTETVGECSITHKFEEFEDFLSWEQVNEDRVQVDSPNIVLDPAHFLKVSPEEALRCNGQP